MNFWQLFTVASAIANGLQSVSSAIAAGQPANAPPIRTYIGSHHVEIDVTIRPI